MALQWIYLHTLVQKKELNTEYNVWCINVPKDGLCSMYTKQKNSRWGARLSVAGSSPLFGFVLLVTEVVVDDCVIGLLPTHHLLRLHTWPQVRKHETNTQKGHYKGPRDSFSMLVVLNPEPVTLLRPYFLTTVQHLQKENTSVLAVKRQLVQ